MSTAKDEQVWIGLAEVRQKPGAGVLLDRNEAIVNVLALARDEPSFSRAVTAALDSLGFDLVEIEEPEPLHQRAAQYEVDAGLIALASEVEATGQTRFGTFHTWTANDE